MHTLSGVNLTSLVIIVLLYNFVPYLFRTSFHSKHIYCIKDLKSRTRLNELASGFSVFIKRYNIKRPKVKQRVKSIVWLGGQAQQERGTERRYVVSGEHSTMFFVQVQGRIDNKETEITRGREKEKK